ncbi:uncharacterized protein METZ01_LOCUS190804 [marine metagenome]|uniref:Uncharacterized protein n=1 Tax=marine metagenome TaxID=408172 RepID=A0A382DHH9_9ZZZZ
MSHEYGHVNNLAAMQKEEPSYSDPEGMDLGFWDFGFDALGKGRTGPDSPKRRFGEADWVDKFNIGGNILGGLGDLASGWAALQNVGIARQSQKFKEDAWRQNMARQKTTVNNPIRMQQSVLKSDFYNDPSRANSLKLVT